MVAYGSPFAKNAPKRLESHGQHFRLYEFLTRPDEHRRCARMSCSDPVVREPYERRTGGHGEAAASCGTFQSQESPSWGSRSNVLGIRGYRRATRVQNGRCAYPVDSEPFIVLSTGAEKHSQGHGRPQASEGAMFSCSVAPRLLRPQRRPGRRFPRRNRFGVNGTGTTGG